jgi:hypothetical protein
VGRARVVLGVQRDPELGHPGRDRHSLAIVMLRSLVKRRNPAASSIDFGSISAKASQDTAFHRKKFPKLVIFRTL